jgi:hypothetical protein
MKARMTDLGHQSTPSPDSWTALAACPADWAAMLTDCPAGFFQTPLGVLAGAPAGEPRYFVLHHEGAVCGVAVGVRHGCRLSRQPRHIYFPSPPAVHGDPAFRNDAVAALMHRLRHDGYAEARVDSFDARALPADGAILWPHQRREYVVNLAVPPDTLLAECGHTHRRYIHRGDRAGWTLRTHTGAEARQVVVAAHETARSRAGRRGRGFDSEIPPVIDHASSQFDAPWGTAVFAAWDGTTLLSALLIGWACHHVYCIMGGSTDAGYEQSASTWMHYQIMASLGEAGFTSYNLGGAPALEATAGGLRQFKHGFGSVEVECMGTHARFRPLHVRGHELGGRLGAWRTA